MDKIKAHLNNLNYFQKKYLAGLTFLIIYSIVIIIFFPDKSSFKFGDYILFRGNFFNFLILIATTITIVPLLKSKTTRTMVIKEEIPGITKVLIIFAILEEIAFSYLMLYCLTATLNLIFNGLFQVAIEVISVVIIAMIFSTQHKWDPNEKLFSFLYFTTAGLILRLFFLSFGLLGSIILHFTHNFAGTLTDYYFPEKF